MGIFNKKTPVNIDRMIIADLIVEEYRFMKSFTSAVNKLYPEERVKYVSVFNFHLQKINDIADKAQLGVPQMDGKEYDVGLPVTPLNVDEFDKEDMLVIQQVIEPPILDKEDGTVIRAGSVILAVKKQEEIQKDKNNSEGK